MDKPWVTSLDLRQRFVAEKSLDGSAAPQTPAGCMLRAGSVLFLLHTSLEGRLEHIVALRPSQPTGHL